MLARSLRRCRRTCPTSAQRRVRPAAAAGTRGHPPPSKPDTSRVPAVTNLFSSASPLQPVYHRLLNHSGKGNTLKHAALLFAVLVLVGCGGTGPDGTGGGSGGGTGGAGGGGSGGGGAAACSAANCPGCCFNGTCQAGVAAGACGKSGTTCAACGTNQVCKSDQSCGVDPQAMFKVQPVSATITPTIPGTTTTWDLTSPPDVIVNLWCPATAAAVTSSTPEATDSYNPTWSTGGCLMKASDLMSQGFAISAFDNDPVGSDPITSKGTIIVTEAQLIAGTRTLTGAGQTMTVEFQRQ